MFHILIVTLAHQSNFRLVPNRNAKTSNPINTSKQYGINNAGIKYLLPEKTGNLN